MQNIIDYFNIFLSVIFGGSSTNPQLSLLTPYNLFNILDSVMSAHSYDISFFLGYVVSHPSVLFSAIVWCWFAWLTLHLLLIWPFKWLRSVVKR